jgi:hypothetical protein
MTPTGRIKRAVFSLRRSPWAPAVQTRTMKVLCVAEKPSISKAVSGHLSGGSFQTVSEGPAQLAIMRAAKLTDRCLTAQHP